MSNISTQYKKGHLPTYLEKGEKHCGWKGDRVTYWGLHKWVMRNFGQPDTCENCKTSGLKARQIHWANLSHLYKRNRDDWARLCQSCHRLYDNGKLILNLN